MLITLCSVILCSQADSACSCHIQFWMSDCSLLQHGFEYNIYMLLKTLTKRQFGFQAISNSASKLRNAVPQAIRKADSVVAFRRLKKHLLCEWLDYVSLFKKKFSDSLYTYGNWNWLKNYPCIWLAVLTFVPRWRRYHSTMLWWTSYWWMHLMTWRTPHPPSLQSSTTDGSPMASRRR